MSSPHALFSSSFRRFHHLQTDGQRDFTSPYVDDGLLEVVGFKDAWHGLVLLAPNGHGTRLAQVPFDFCICFLPFFIPQGSLQTTLCMPYAMVCVA